MTRASGMVALTLGALAFGQPASAQSIAERISAVRTGSVELHFASRPGVCGNGGERISVGRSTQFGSSDDGYSSLCEPGPVRVRLLVEDGVVRNIRTSVGPARSRSGGTPSTDLGAVPARDAAAYFLQLAKTANEHVSTPAVTVAVLADSVYPWRPLLEIARDSATRGHGTRSNAELWLSRFAGEKLSGRENNLTAPDDRGTESDESDARKYEVFALSQLRNREGIPPLLQVARTNRDASVRRAALFWLGQSGDARALQLFEEILRG